MKVIKALITSCITIFSMSAGAGTIGLHTISWHDKQGYNNNNYGLYIKNNEGWVAGFLKNSLRRDSLYLAKTFERKGKVADYGLIVGSITGYNFAPIVPLIATSISIDLGLVNLRTLYLPRLLKQQKANCIHFTIEKSF